jgi:hypothetical protein
MTELHHSATPSQSSRYRLPIYTNDCTIIAVISIRPKAAVVVGWIEIEVRKTNNPSD